MLHQPAPREFADRQTAAVSAHAPDKITPAAVRDSTQTNTYMHTPSDQQTGRLLPACACEEHKQWPRKAPSALRHTHAQPLPRGRKAGTEKLPCCQQT